MKKIFSIISLSIPLFIMGSMSVFAQYYPDYSYNTTYGTNYNSNYTYPNYNYGNYNYYDNNNYGNYNYGNTYSYTGYTPYYNTYANTPTSNSYQFTQGCYVYNYDRYTGITSLVGSNCNVNTYQYSYTYPTTQYSYWNNYNCKKPYYHYPTVNCNTYNGSRICY